MPWTHYFYDPVYVSYTNTNTAPKVSSQISVFLLNLYIGHDSRCMYTIQLITCICVATHITDLFTSYVSDNLSPSRRVCRISMNVIEIYLDLRCNKCLRLQVFVLIIRCVFHCCFSVLVRTVQSTFGPTEDWTWQHGART